MAKAKFYTVADTETATIGWANTLKNPTDKKKIAITFPLVYDFGFTLTDGKGEVIEKRSFLIEEIYNNLTLFNTAYYKDKRPIYEDLIQAGKIQIVPFIDALREFSRFANKSEMLCAFNACFDFKKALPFTANYIYHYYYKNDGEQWMQEVIERAKAVISGADKSKNPDYLTPSFIMFGKSYKICDLWGVGVERLANNNRYKKFCLKNGYLTASGKYFSTTVETLYRYLKKNTSFIESHTALSDAEIESYILKKVLKKGKIFADIRSFPCQMLGTTFEFVALEGNKKYIDTVKEAVTNYKSDGKFSDKYLTYLDKVIQNLEAM